jgi:hypothetical protein
MLRVSRLPSVAGSTGELLAKCQGTHSHPSLKKRYRPWTPPNAITDVIIRAMLVLYEVPTRRKKHTEKKEIFIISASVLVIACLPRRMSSRSGCVTFRFVLELRQECRCFINDLKKETHL